MLSCSVEGSPVVGSEAEEIAEGASDCSDSQDTLIERLFFGSGASVDLARRVFQRFGKAVQQEGYIFVRLRLQRDGKTPILRIVVERNDETPMTVTDCATISRFLSPLLEGEGLVSPLTRLEVSSPGIERDLTRIRDFRRFAGREIAIELDRDKDQEKEHGGKRRFRGKIVATEGGKVVLETHEGRLSFSLAALLKCCLVLPAGSFASRVKRT